MLGVTRCRKLTADRLYRIAVQTEISSGAGGNPALQDGEEGALLCEIREARIWGAPPISTLVASVFSMGYVRISICKAARILLKYAYGLVVTNNPREASICFNCQIALSAAAELLACSICRRSAFSEGSLSRIAHRHKSTLASWRLATRTVWLAPGKLAVK